MICYETEMKAQREITKINRYKGWRAEKHIKSKATTTGNQFKERSSRCKKTKMFQGLYPMNYYYESVMNSVQSLNTSRLHFTTFEKSIFAQKWTLVKLPAVA